MGPMSRRSQDPPSTVQDEHWSSGDASEPDGQEAEDDDSAARAAEFEQAILEQHEDHASPESLGFCACVGLSVFANVQIVALETDYGCIEFDCTIEERLPWYIFDHLFTVLFILDVLATIKATGLKRYFRGDPMLDTMGFSLFNCVDCLIVILRMVDVWALGLAGIPTGLKLISLLRVVHITRFVRRMRLVSAFRELWLVVAGTMDTIRVVAWVAVLLVLLIWAFATVVTLAVGSSDPRQFDFRQSTWTKDEYWGNIPRSMFSLFQAFTGDGWSSALTAPLIKKQPVLALLFLAFRVVTILALVNTIVGVIVETTLSSARANEETRSRDKQRKDAMVMESLREIFRQADADSSGELDREELAAMVRTPSVRDRMRMLEIPVKQLQLLHSLLDQDGSGQVQTDYFFRGCSRLRGPAMAVDLHQMSIDLDRHIALADEHIAQAGEVNDALADLLDSMELVDVDIVKGDGDVKDPVLMARRGRARQPKANILRSANWVDHRPPPFLVDEELAATGTPRVSSISRKSLVRATLRNNPDQNAHAHVQAVRPALVPHQPGSYMQPTVPPPPPPLPMDMGEGSRSGPPARKPFLYAAGT